MQFLHVLAIPSVSSNLKCDADFFFLAITVQPPTASQKPSDQSEYVFLVQVHSILHLIAWFYSSFNFRPCFQHLPLKPSITFDLIIKVYFFKASPVTTVQSTTASRSLPDQSEYIIMSSTHFHHYYSLYFNYKL